MSTILNNEMGDFFQTIWMSMAPFISCHCSTSSWRTSWKKLFTTITLLFLSVGGSTAKASVQLFPPTTSSGGPAWPFFSQCLSRNELIFTSEIQRSALCPVKKGLKPQVPSITHLVCMSFRYIEFRVKQIIFAFIRSKLSASTKYDERF